MTGIENFKTFLSGFPNYSDEAFKLAEPHLKVSRVKKRAHILHQGKTCRHIHFVASGLLKMYYLRDGGEITTCFCKENRIATAYQSLISKQPSEMAIQAVEASEVVSMPFDTLQELYAQGLFWQQMGRMVVEEEYIITACYTRLINDKSAKQRYLEILNNDPELLQRASLADLASYLQVTPETISRIRKQLSVS